MTPYSTSRGMLYSAPPDTESTETDTPDGEDTKATAVDGNAAAADD